MTIQGGSEETIQEILENWKGQTILVIKEELNNIDQAYLHLTDFKVREVARDTDDYLENRNLELIGGGETVENSGEAPLPYARYDIPLSHLEAVQTEGNQLSIKNDRASYTLYPV